MHWLPPGRPRSRLRRIALVHGIPSFVARLTFALLACAGSAVGGEVVVFGSEVYRGTGLPHTVTNTFRTEVASDDFLLRVTNHGVTSAAIAIDGRVVVGPADIKRGGFDRAVPSFKRWRSFDCHRASQQLRDY